MPVSLVYTSTSGPSRAHRWGWDAVDAMVLWAASQTPRATFDDVVRLVPDGIHLRLVSKTLRHLVEAGELERGRTLANGRITATYTAATAAHTRKAA
jgi:hypothetical protein